MNKLHIELELQYSLGDDEYLLTQNISDVVIENESEFNELMERVCSKYDMRAELLSETLQVHNVSLSGYDGVISVEYDYDAYYGCKDMDNGDGVQEEWKFKLKDNKIIFDLELPERERYDEI